MADTTDHDRDLENGQASDDNGEILDDPEEQQVLYKAVNSFSRYRDQAHYHVTHKRRQAFYALPQKHWTMLSAPPFNMLDTFDRIDAAIEKNAAISDVFVASAVEMFGLDPPSTSASSAHFFATRYSRAEDYAELPRAKAAWEGPPNPVDQEKAHSTIKQLYRDWSAEGAPERRACIDSVIKALDDNFHPIPLAQRGRIKVLVPGAGLGRSVFEINRAGYAVEGNEISYHQVIASNYMLNRITEAGQFELYPWIHGFSNHLSRDDQLQCVRIPDVVPSVELEKVAATSEIHPFERLSFSSADFCVAYKDFEAKDTFDAVATIFFIDTAPNVIKYFEAVHHCLKPGGIWVNLGPLKWHFENDSPGSNNSNEGALTEKDTRSGEADQGIGDPGSIELTEDEVMALLDTMGFTVERHETSCASAGTGYIDNPRSMWRSVYHPSLWVVRKR